MKIKYTIPMALGLLMSVAYASPVQAQGVTRAKAAELSLHRLERLVILKKVEDSFQSKIKGIKLELIAHTAETEPSFKSTILQYSGADGTQKSLEVILDEQGKALKNTVGPGADAQGAFSWPDQDATTLCENSLHYIQDNVVTKPELAPYTQNLSELSLSQGTNSAGAAVAVVDMQTSPATSILRVRMKFDGTVDSSEIVNRTE